MNHLPEAPAAAQGPPPAPGSNGRLRNIALFFAGPFITLAHLVMLPFFLFGELSRSRDDKAKDGRLS
jgi:hypothetical protein